MAWHLERLRERPIYAGTAIAIAGLLVACGPAMPDAATATPGPTSSASRAAMTEENFVKHVRETLLTASNFNGSELPISEADYFVQGDQIGIGPCRSPSDVMDLAAQKYLQAVGYMRGDNVTVNAPPNVDICSVFMREHSGAAYCAQESCTGEPPMKENDKVIDALRLCVWVEARMANCRHRVMIYGARWRARGSSLSGKLHRDAFVRETRATLSPLQRLLEQ